jgi:Radical SAM superfamily
MTEEGTILSLGAEPAPAGGSCRQMDPPWRQNTCIRTCQVVERGTGSQRTLRYNRAVRVILVSTYELGRQPFGLASPAAWLRREGVDVHCLDLSRGRLDEPLVRGATLVAFHLPMHTATRLAIRVIDRVRALNPDAHLCAYGLYALPNADALRAHGVSSVLGPEFEADLVELVASPADSQPAPANPGAGPARTLPRLQFVAPDRQGLPELDRYAALQMPDGSRRVVGYTESSRGCKHRCRHCPVVPVYDGHFRVVQSDIVAADIRAQIERGATHITFGDPDFFNGIGHALRVVSALASDHPGVSYDVVVKIEHLLAHRSALATLRDTGCAFVTSAVESVDDEILKRLEKGHTRADFETAVGLLREVRLPLAPTFVAFNPWITLSGYCELLDTIERLDLVDAVAPVQLSIRLLIPSGSRLLELADIRGLVDGFDPNSLAWRWSHPDPEVDRLQRDVGALVGRRITAPRRRVFDAIRSLARERAGLAPIVMAGGGEPRVDRAAVPYLTEPWYC